MRQFQLDILYIGSNSDASTSRHRADALRRLGANVRVIDLEVFLRLRRRWQAFIDYRTGYILLQQRLLFCLKHQLSAYATRPGLIWVNSGELLGPEILKWLKATFQCPIVLYQNDDPTGCRDGARFSRLRAAFKFYDLCVFVRPETALDAVASGAPKSLRVLMSFDETIHVFSRPASPIYFNQSVSFVGTFIHREGRDSFLLALANAGLPVQLRGNSWQRSRLWPLLEAYFFGPGVIGKPYAQILHLASISLGLLSHQNRDLVTRRSVEVTACGGLLCAERTSEHQLLYEEGVEAFFWDTPDECIQKCNVILSDPELNQSVRFAGSRRIQEMGVGNEDICRQILASVA